MKKNKNIVKLMLQKLEKQNKIVVYGNLKNIMNNNVYIKALNGINYYNLLVPFLTNELSHNYKTFVAFNVVLQLFALSSSLSVVNIMYEGLIL
jgi:hypothetical protein